MNKSLRSISTVSKLAIHGGVPIIKGALPADSTIGEAEFNAVRRVFDRGSLSGFYGSWGDEFLGGVEVKEFEKAWAKQFNVPHAISVNSATSGLYAAMGALGISPGDEVIVPPYTMSASVMAPLIYGAIPVFVDIEPETFCLDIAKVAQAITNRTKAIIAVNLFGHPAKLQELAALARAKGIYLVEDNAQGPLAMEHGQYAGTIGDIGVFSLNYHKHVHTGEGGVCVTFNSELALRLQAIRNHAENIVDPAPILDPVNMIGYNYRMTEMSAAVGISQLANIEMHVSRRQQLAEALSAGLADLEGVAVPVVRPNCRHVYYVWSARLDERTLGVSRDKFSRALAAEGFPHFVGYVRPLYLLPAFQRRIAIGRDGWPFTLTDRKYEKGMCPVAERMYEHELLCFETCAYSVNDELVEKLIGAFRKVHENRHVL
jgi:dTDP-4-amino-4,6-dideoxygalactose transaminase